MKYETIIDALKTETGARVISGPSKWLFFDETHKEWVVMEQGYRKRKPTTLYRGESEMLAINILIE